MITLILVAISMIISRLILLFRPRKQNYLGEDQRTKTDHGNMLKGGTITLCINICHIRVNSDSIQCQ